MQVPSSSRGCEITHAPQTKILERMTKEEIRISNEALFKGVSTRFGLLTIEAYIENPDFLFCHSFQNLRLGGVTSHHFLFATWESTQVQTLCMTSIESFVVACSPGDGDACDDLAGEWAAGSARGKAKAIRESVDDRNSCTTS